MTEAQISHFFPLFNFSNLLYKPETRKVYGGGGDEARSGAHAELRDDITQTYFAPKWLWRISNSCNDTKQMMQHFRRAGEKPSAKPSRPTTVSAAPVQAKPTSIWGQIKDISDSKEYDSFLSKFNEMTVGDSQNYGVTVKTTVDALKQTGDQKLRRLRLTLDAFDVKRGEIQVLFHEEFIQSTLSIIYRGEWEFNYDDIMRRNRVTSNSRERFIICPRRFGKTWSVAMFAAAFIWVIPNITISIFSRGKRMAQKLMFLCLRYIMKLPAYKEKLKTSNSEQIVFEFGPHDTRTLCCLPGSVEACITVILIICVVHLFPSSITKEVCLAIVY